MVEKSQVKSIKFLGSLVPQIIRQSFCIKMVNGSSHIMIPVMIKTCARALSEKPTPKLCHFAIIVSGNCAPKFSNAQKLSLHSCLLSIIL